jgi:hypothetical protein
MNANNLRPDNTVKGMGFLGAIPRLDNPKDSSTELSIGVDWGSGEKLIPTMVPTLDDNELKYLLSTPADKLNSVNPDLNKSITRKAVEFAKERESKKLPFFAQPDESPKSPRAISSENKNEFIQKFIQDKQIVPKFILTPEQEKAIAGTQYGKIQDKTPLKQSFLARIIAGDESVGTITPMQKRWADWLKTQLPQE